MKVKYWHFHTLILWFFLALSGVIFQAPAGLAAPIPLTLDQAIQRMIENNLSIKNLRLTLDYAEVSYDTAWNTFYMPSFTLNAASTSAYSVGSVPFTLARSDSSIRTRGYPTSAVDLTLGSYTIFNFFKDRATYDIAKLEYERAKLRYQEGVRNARFGLIASYFTTKIAQEKLEAAERSVTISQALEELLQSRRRLGKATEDELNSASVDLLNAKVSLLNERKNVEQIVAQLNTLLNATPETEFKLVTEPPFVPVLLDEKHLFNVYKTQSPSAREAELALAKAEMTASLAEKSRLPLPKLDFSGIKISYSNGYSAGTSPVYTTETPGAGTNAYGLVEVAAMLSFTIPIFGPNGFFNSNQVKGAYIFRDASEVSHKVAMMNGELTIRQKIANIKRLEGEIKTLRESFTKNAKILNNLFSKASNTSTDRLQLRDALLQSRQSELSYLDSLLNHINEKNTLSDFIGLDRLPGDQL